MARRLYEIQEEAYQKALEFCVGSIKIINPDLTENIERNKGKIIELLDNLCQGEESGRTIDRVV